MGAESKQMLVRVGREETHWLVQKLVVEIAGRGVVPLAVALIR